jgi:hypothetical protein
MMVVEVLRIRSWFLWCAGIIAAIGILLMLTLSHAGVVVNDSRINGIMAPLDVLAPIAMFVTMVFATSVGLSLNRESATRALSWTKPLSRSAIALRIVAVDALALLAIDAFTWIVMLAFVAAAHGSVFVSPTTAVTVALSIGVIFMWYALLQALTAGFGAGARMIVTALWPAALILSSLDELGGTAGRVIAVLNAVNPIAYLNGVTTSEGVHRINAYWQFPVADRALVVWIATVLLSALAVALWTRREAS